MTGMFDEIQRAVQKLHGTHTIEITMPLDEDKYFDRLCPHDKCGSSFKVLFDDWKTKVGDYAHCPICGCTQESSKWNTPSQKTYIKQAGVAAMQRKLGMALSHAVRQTQSETFGGFLSMSLSYKPGSPTIVIPSQAAKAMQLKFACEKCGCRYAAVGFAFFCPACGHESVVAQIGEMLDSESKAIESVPRIIAHLTETSGEDMAKGMARSIYENKMVDMVGLFQRFGECLFLSVPGVGSPSQNVFQRLDEGSDLWNNKVGQSFESMLEPDEYKRLKMYFQRRHVLAHCYGVIDQKYLDKSGDRTYSVGQRLVVSSSDVKDICDLLFRLCKNMKNSVSSRLAAITPAIKLFAHELHFHAAA